MWGGRYCRCVGLGGGIGVIWGASIGVIWGAGIEEM